MRDDIDTQQRTSDAVHDEIEQKRAELDDTLGEIGRRLSPEELKQHLRAYVQESLTNAVEVARRNPASVAAAALTVAGTLLVRHRRHAQEAELQAAQVRSVWDQIVTTLSHVSEDHRPIAEAVSRAADLAQRARAGVADFVSDPHVENLAEPAQRLVAAVEARARENTLLSLAIAAGIGATLSTMLRR